MAKFGTLKGHYFDILLNVKREMCYLSVYGITHENHHNYKQETDRSIELRSLTTTFCIRHNGGTLLVCYNYYSISQEICTRFCCALLCCGYAIVHNEFT